MLFHLLRTFSNILSMDMRMELDATEISEELTQGIKLALKTYISVGVHFFRRIHLVVPSRRSFFHPTSPPAGVQSRQQNMTDALKRTGCLSLFFGPHEEEFKEVAVRQIILRVVHFGLNIVCDIIGLTRSDA